MKIFILCLTFVLGGCSSWPRVNILGDDYYLLPFTYGEEISLPLADKGSASSSARRKSTTAQ